MKKIIILFFALIACYPLLATNYYFSSTEGDDSNTGTSHNAPFKSLSKINGLELKAGDMLLLKKDDVFQGSIELIGISGDKKNPITISTYGKGTSKPCIDAKGFLNGILIEDCNHISVSDIKITANGGGVSNFDPQNRYMRCGILIKGTNDGEYAGIKVDNVVVRDIFFEDEGFSRTLAESLTAMGTQNYGWGIRVLNSSSKSFIRDIKITNCHVKNVSHTGIKATGSYAFSTDSVKNIKNVQILNNVVEHAGGPGIQASVVKDISFIGNRVDHSGSNTDSRKWARGSGLWVWGCLNALIEQNSFRNANGPGDSSGCHIDFNNTNVIIQYNVSENNAGGFIHIFGNNRNCTYRYNVSINDGWRVHEEGKTLGQGYMVDINGWVGRNKKENGPFNTYIYNNTIYVKGSLHPEVGIAKSNSGILFANNIFYLESTPTYRDKANFMPENGPVPNVVFKNNLYLKADNWPEASKVMITDKAPVYGNPKFANVGGKEIKDYTPTNVELIKNKGIEIEKIPGDSIGLWGGLKVKKDILGNKIKALPDMGAIEMK